MVIVVVWLVWLVLVLLGNGINLVHYLEIVKQIRKLFLFFIQTLNLQGFAEVRFRSSPLPTVSYRPTKHEFFQHSTTSATVPDVDP
jgi:hypothetical protein